MAAIILSARGFRVPMAEYIVRELFCDFIFSDNLGMESSKKQVPVTRFCHECRVRWQSAVHFTEYCPRCCYLPTKLNLSWWQWTQCMIGYAWLPAKSEIDLFAFTEKEPYI